MGDRRRYTGTQMLQALWTVFALAIGALIQLLQPIVGGMLDPVVFLTVSGLWIVGLLGIALYDRHKWGEMVSGSSFQPDTSTRIADLESLKGGRSVVVLTTIPDMLSQTHMEVRTPIEGVNASFTIKLSYVGDGGSEEGIQIGTEALDESFVIRGNRDNISQLLSPEIQSQLMDIETEGTFTITGNAVEFEIPFTRLAPTELEQVADVSLAIAEHVESLAGSSPATN